MADWNPTLYMKFGAERTQPSIDLASRISHPAPKRVLDVGCGPGNSTEVLAARFPGSKVMGIDNSPAMLEEAKGNYPAFDFLLCDAATGLSALEGGCDAIFSNAVLQWVPDHPRVMGELIELLSPGGVLAVQIPYNQEQPVQRVIRELAASPRWEKQLGDARPHTTMTPSDYYNILSAHAGKTDLWETTYYHVLASHTDILQWYRSTGLRPYLNRLSADEAEAFEKEWMERIISDYPIQQNGKVLFPFPRLFFTFQAEE